MRRKGQKEFVWWMTKIMEMVVLRLGLRVRMRGTDGRRLPQCCCCLCASSSRRMCWPRSDCLAGCWEQGGNMRKRGEIQEEGRKKGDRVRLTTIGMLCYAMYSTVCSDCSWYSFVAHTVFAFATHGCCDASFPLVHFRRMFEQRGGMGSLAGLCVTYACVYVCTYVQIV